MDSYKEHKIYDSCRDSRRYKEFFESLRFKYFFRVNKFFRVKTHKSGHYYLEDSKTQYGEFFSGSASGF